MKFRELVLDETSGKSGYRTKLYPDIIPKKIKEQNKQVCVGSDMVIGKNRDSTISAIKTPVKLDYVESALLPQLKYHVFGNHVVLKMLTLTMCHALIRCATMSLMDTTLCHVFATFAHFLKLPRFKT